jgi:hypothetical protein
MRNIGLVFLAVIALSIAAVAQTTTNPTPAGFVASSDALAINCNGVWGVGNLSKESYDFLDYGATKASRLFLDGIEVTAPSCGLSVFGGGVTWQPDLSGLFNKTNFSGGNFLVGFTASAGNGIPATGASRMSAVAGGYVKYVISDNLTWNTVQCGMIFFGADRDPYCSSGIAGYFGGNPASPAVSSNVKRSLVKRIASATSRLMAR